MRRSDPTFDSQRPAPRRPVLTALVGMGLLIGAWASVGVPRAPASVPDGPFPPGHGFVGPDSPTPAGIHPAAGWTSWVAPESRPPSRRAGGTAVDLDGGGSPSGVRGHSSSGATRGAGPRGIVRSRPDARFTRDALARSGRHSAPTTAPPSTPF